MQNREFEKNVQQKMEELQFTPADAVWDKVEASLPEEKKRRWIIYILLFAVLMAGSLFLWNNVNTHNKKQPLNSTAIKDNKAYDSVSQNTTSIKQVPDINTSSVINETSFVTGVNTDAGKTAGKKILSSASLKIKIKNATTGFEDDAAGDEGTGKRNKRIKTAGHVEVKVKTSQQFSDSEEKLAESKIEIATSDRTNTIVNEDTASLKKDNLIAVTKKPATDSSSIIKKDTAIVVKKQTQNKNSKQKWQYGIELAAGISNVKSSLFNSMSVYSNVLSNLGGGTVVTSANNFPNKPMPGVTFSLGFYIQHNINERWKFKSGINYLYQSNTIKVGSKVDTVTNFNFDMNKSILASSYYRSGNSVSYNNKVYLVEVPLLFQYRFSKASPVYAEAGPGIACLLQSNTLVYNTSSQAYVADKNIYNKLLLSLNAGAGVTLAQKAKLPFTVGFMFKYGAGSLVKKSFGKQHLTNTLLYLRVPFKK